MDDQVYDLIVTQLKDLNTKVDELVAFKYYFIGVSAAVASVVAGAVGIISKTFFS